MRNWKLQLIQRAIAFEQPSAAYVLRLEDTSLAELMRAAAAWDIVLKHLPFLAITTSAPMMKPHMGNVTVQSLAAFMMRTSAEVLAAIDAELARFPPVKDSAS